MSNDTVRVRFVPKAPTGAFSPFNAGAPPLGGAAPNLTPEFKGAEAAAEFSDSAKLSSRITPKHRVETDVRPEDFSSMFGTELEVVSRPKDSKSGTLFAEEKFLAPKTELKVPDELKDSIAFAYVPTPVEFYGMSAVAPKPSIYHVTLTEVGNALRAGQCHREGFTGNGITVAMTDSGFAPHPFFEQQGFNITRLTPETAIDPSGHGTGESANVLMIAPDVQFIGVKNDYSAAVALEDALDQNPNIVTNSWGWDWDRQSWSDLQIANPNLYNEFRDIENIVNDAVNSGVVMIFSAGNGHRAFPACLTNAMAIGGVTIYPDETLKASSYASSFQSQLFPGRQVPDFCGIVGESSSPPMKGHIMLPVPNGCNLEGSNLPNSAQNKGWGIFSGTSAAAPQLAGVVALMLSANPTLTPTQVKAILASTCTDVTKGSTAMDDAAATGYDLATGTGLVNAHQACQSAFRRLELNT